MLIQIMDTGTGWWPQPAHAFLEVHRFEFLDVEAQDQVDDEEMRISEQQAREIVQLLEHALDKRMNVVVHCFAGVSRSGAVAQFGVELGFNDCERFRQPNTLVLELLRQARGQA